MSNDGEDYDESEFAMMAMKISMEMIHKEILKKKWRRKQSKWLDEQLFMAPGTHKIDH